MIFSRRNIRPSSTTSTQWKFKGTKITFACGSCGAYRKARLRQANTGLGTDTSTIMGGDALAVAKCTSCNSYNYFQHNSGAFIHWNHTRLGVGALVLKNL